MKIRVLVVDDHEFVRAGLATVICGDDLEIVATAGDGKQALEAVQEFQPDVVVLDVRMPEADGLWALNEIKQAHPQTRVVMYSGYDNPTYLARAVALGADEYMVKTAPIQEMAETVRRVSRGEASENGSLIKSMRMNMCSTQSTPGMGVELTGREHQVLRHVALGLSNREIGRSLNISYDTVKEHVQNVLRKLNVKDRTQAAVWALGKKVID